MSSSSAGAVREVRCSRSLVQQRVQLDLGGERLTAAQMQAAPRSAGALAFHVCVMAASAEPSGHMGPHASGLHFVPCATGKAVLIPSHAGSDATLNYVCNVPYVGAMCCRSLVEVEAASKRRQWPRRGRCVRSVSLGAGLRAAKRTTAAQRRTDGRGRLR